MTLQQEQPQRSFMIGAVLSASQIELWCFRADGTFSRSGLHTLQPSASSFGLQLLARLLTASSEQLGYTPPSIPPPGDYGSYPLVNFTLLQRAQTADPRASRVYATLLQDGSQAVIKFAADALDEVSMVIDATCINYARGKGDKGRGSHASSHWFVSCSGSGQV